MKDIAHFLGIYQLLQYGEKIMVAFLFKSQLEPIPTNSKTMRIFSSRITVLVLSEHLMIEKVIF